MNLKSTFALLILAAAAGFWLWKGDELVPRLAPKGAPADTPTVTALETDFTPEKITRIEITPPGGDPFVFVREGDSWSQPGSWPLRTVEVNELVQALGTLRTRFQPVPAEGDLKAFGLAESQKPLSVKVTAGGKEYALKFGEPELKPGEAPFTRPAYVQVNGTSELLKLGPDVMPVLRRPADSYRRRQLFPEVERVKFAGAPRFTQPGAPPEPPVPETVALPSGKIEEVRVGGEPATFFGHAVWPESPAFTLRRTGPTPAPAVTERNAEATVQPDRLADAWEVSSPRRDRPDPAALRRVLAAVPELWVEKFLPAKEVGFAVDHP